MSTLVIKSFPKEIHQFLKESAHANRRSLTQEVITKLERLMLLEKKEEKAPEKIKLTPEQVKVLTFSGRRKLVPGYLEAAQAFAGGTDSSVMISEERDLW